MIYLMWYGKFWFECWKKYKKQKQQKQNSNEIEEEKCNHLFVPIDSTKQILACSKCGEIYKLKKGEVNPFE